MGRIQELIEKVADSTAKVVGVPTTEPKDAATAQREADQRAREEAARRGVRRA